MLFFLLYLACGGNRFSTAPLGIESCPTWEDLLATAQSGDRIVGCTDRALSLIGPDDVILVAERWSTALQTRNLLLLHDDQTPAQLEGESPMISQEWGLTTPELALSIAHNGHTHVSLVVVP